MAENEDTPDQMFYDLTQTKESRHSTILISGIMFICVEKIISEKRHIVGSAAEGRI